MEESICGIVMPISSIDGCGESHWKDVYGILEEAIQDAGYKANMVSDSDDVGVIQKRIIQNLYENPIVVCDVSGKNPNVMFELGMRLAFDKPTIIVKDDETAYSFDTSSIEHIEYPRDLRFTDIVRFKAKLSEKIKNTIEKSTSDPSYTTFLKHFGEFKVAKIETKEVTGQELILDEIRNLKSTVANLEARRVVSRNTFSQYEISVCAKNHTIEEVEFTFNLLTDCPQVKSSTIRMVRKDHPHLEIALVNKSDFDEVEDIIAEHLPSSTFRVKK
ncbi:TPA: hypothetical protein NKQ81_004667 [Vibrio parahaemolyticus]|uniref:hypothetical protein n=1 Tax=Vibrio parahaemolyticus TaxID=670 RepID=UPI00186A2007|nr:hypothetical protein [Vibrio parahaemolyticus]MCR9877577.1 hypothetical protein [Vibrio parahaemolyticus]MCR9893280.1 hypothetical protein [Vibrio parahaemolyticus]HCH1474617.1 hypothetical protein [Vibrio parahaemolyticus]